MNAKEAQTITDTIAVIASLMVDRPAEVTAILIETSKDPVIQLRVHSSDAGKIIGKQGRTARAIRTILQAMCNTANLHMVLDIVSDAPVQYPKIPALQSRPVTGGQQ